MNTEDKKKFADAWRKSMDRNPEADAFIQQADERGGRAVFISPDKQLTQRDLLEMILAEESTYKEVDDVLAANTGVTLDRIIESEFGPQSPPAEISIKVIREPKNSRPKI